MWRIRHAAKSAIAHVLHYSGILGLWRAITLRNRCVVLMYHRVLSPTERARTASHPGYVVSVETFARQMEYLSRRFKVLSEQQFAQHLLDARPFPHSSCLLTFDDGWRDNLSNALPVLRKHGLPAVVFLPVNFIGKRRLFWREALTHLLLNAVRLGRESAADRGRLREALDAHGLAHVLDITEPDARPAVIELVEQQWHRRMRDDGRLLEALESATGCVASELDTPDTFLSWDQVREMAACGVSFGGHGTEHRLLGELPADEADREVRESRQVISRHVGMPLLGFSYPNGSFTPAVADMVKAAGYLLGFTTKPGSIDVRQDRLRIRRVNIHEDMTQSTPMFLARILGLF